MSEKYQILARKYRPQAFKEVIGQDAIVTTIKNSIRLKKTAHAYLFSGNRGTGKTTLARLFAKAINCTESKDDQEPCNICKSCQEIASSRSLDVIEIDGASNRGIDDIRQINDTIGYTPYGKYKIYIIDEVHMLTKEAFNALLKTLEEPPEQIKFFFATTEAHKVLPTILSRCQRFELKRIPHLEIVNKLKSISDDLNRKIDPDAIHMIANFSEGSLRDAESLLDQLFCYHEGIISTEDINKALGFISKDIFFELDEKIQSCNIHFSFEFIDTMYKSGKDLIYLIDELIEHFRNLLIAKLDNLTLINMSDNSKEKYLQSSQKYSEKQLFYILDLLIKYSQNHSKSTFKKVNLEMLLLNIIKSKNMISLDILINRLMDIDIKPHQNAEPIAKPIPISTENQQEPNLQPIKFNLDKKNEIQEKNKVLDKNTQNHYDTLINFTKVELDATSKNQGDI